MSQKVTEKHIKKQLPNGMTPWKPGQSGNPKGRPPKGQTLAEVMREYLSETITDEKGKPYPDKRTRAQAFVKAVFVKAMKGGDAAQRLIMNYIDGMPKQSIDIRDITDDSEKIKAEMIEIFKKSKHAGK